MHLHAVGLRCGCNICWVVSYVYIYVCYTAFFLCLATRLMIAVAFQMHQNGTHGRRQEKELLQIAKLSTRHRASLAVAVTCIIT